MRKILHTAIATTLALARTAHAVQTYPAEIQSHLGLDFTPPCTLCHATNAGGLGTITTPFGKALQAHGLTTDIATLDRALDALADNDSNGDGISDIQQLKNGSDPNTGAHLSNVQQEQFGCGAHIAKLKPSSPGQGLMFASLALLALSRRKKQ